jgi:hypothetical protein
MKDCDNCTRDDAINAFRMDELDAVMHSVDKWLDGPALRNNPATRAADAREIALKAIESEKAAGIAQGRSEAAQAARETMLNLPLIGCVRQSIINAIIGPESEEKTDKANKNGR